MINRHLFSFFILILLIAGNLPSATAQGSKRKSEKLSKKDLKAMESELLFNEEMPLSFRDSLPQDKRTEEKEKKWKRRVFYGIKTRKAFVKTIKRRKRQIELFFVLREYEDPDKYVKDIHWFHIKKRKYHTNIYFQVFHLEKYKKNKLKNI